ncbi:CAP domain-containing protein [Bradyrhizobium japonicum]|jgi:uncharacterized protein YkwD|uniref:CAP domain-containing protein n=1 Tax=Bradyrhizobium japonicum TaxID=375 RepID=UPI001BAA232A|nr:CAP domain-containing protein [Bradyrhizobium japonicum]MBR0995560.1 CAP domain-containing protein [Bradyrhizobium japonicum]
MKPALLFSRAVKLKYSLIIVACVSFSTISGAQIFKSPDSYATADLIMSQVNSYRNSLGLPKLFGHTKLNMAAQAYADYLADTNTQGHQANGTTFDARIRAAGYRPCVRGAGINQLAENLYYYTSRGGPMPPAKLAAAAMQGWKGSPGHDANLRYPTFNDHAVAVAARRDGDVYTYKIAHEFGDMCRPPNVPDANQFGKRIR